MAALLGLFGIPFVLIFEANGLGGGGPTALATVFAVGFAVALGHAVGQAVGDFRLQAHLQAALRSGEARESAAFQAIDDLVTWHDCNGSVVKANGGGARLLGTVPMQLKGRGFFCRIHVADRPAYLKAISDAASATEPRRGAIPDAGRRRDRPAAPPQPRPRADRLAWGAGPRVG